MFTVMCAESCSRFWCGPAWSLGVAISSGKMRVDYSRAHRSSYVVCDPMWS